MSDHQNNLAVSAKKGYKDEEEGKKELGKPRRNPPDPGPKPAQAASKVNFDRSSIDKTPPAHSDPNHNHWKSTKTEKNPFET